MKGLELYLEEMCQIPVYTAINPETCAVSGIKNIVESNELKKHIYSMIEENYRWMR